MLTNRVTLHFLKITGEVDSQKQREFEQTVLFVFNHLTEECEQHSLSVDVHHPHVYHVYSTWNSESSLAAFLSSTEFELIKGAFQTLGSHMETITGGRADIQLFKLNH